ncbi:hypothetical protein E0I26_13555 [Flavobacterium rhamnosiphilum]|uniref:Outer membrane protein assembly factor BamA n=1 Tax=Flavobacterium rhamnosiphilum TaxID=2541724 RepID=A0A4R5F4K5_9FLAO|nr:hypothetical protein E0I26_13555 [Flavobacterium rhamnosiphilum]
MKSTFILLFLLNFCLNCSAQNFRLLITGSNSLETKTIDSLKYNTEHKNTKSISEEINKLSKKLSEIGYIDNTTLEFTKKKDSSYVANFILGKKIKSIHIYIGTNNLFNDPADPDIKKDTLALPYIEIDSFLKQTVQKLEQNGFALAKLKLINLKRVDTEIYADLKLESDEKRTLNSITINYAENNRSNKFPSGHLAQINRKYKNSIFNQKIVGEIYNDFEKFEFISQVKYPEILLTKDTTKVYVYLEKKKSNTFDGFIGFSNNENKKTTLNGYLDVRLENILGSGEQLSVYWKSDGKDQKTFNSSIELPYLLKTPIGLKAQIQLFRQDSTFQNTKTAIDLSYFTNYNTRFYLGYQTTESSDIQNSSDTSISDFSNSFLTSSFNYTKLDLANFTFPIKSIFSIAAGTGKREINNQSENTTKSNQFFLNIQATHNFNLNKKNIININSQNYYLQSNKYIINELFRFGGFNSIRGFTENSLQAYFMTSILTEYRHILSPNLYIHSILDYCIYKNKSGIEQTDNTKKLLGLGLGLGLQTKNGLLRLAIANGSTQNQQIEIYNTIIHICYNVKF